MEGRNARGAIAAALLGGMAVGAMAQEQRLTPPEIQATLVDKKVFARTGNGQLMDFWIRGDGSASVSIGDLNDQGKWRLSDAGYCVTWSTIRRGEERCFTVVRRGASLVVLNQDQSVSADVLRLE